jgi:hypothetical protein
MADDKHETRNTAVAAGIILLVGGLAVFFMPKIVLGIGAYSPVLGFAAGMVIVLFFFLVFWLRSKYKK